MRCISDRMLVASSSYVPTKLFLPAGYAADDGVIGGIGHHKNQYCCLAFMVFAGLDL